MSARTKDLKKQLADLQKLASQQLGNDWNSLLQIQIIALKTKLRELQRTNKSDEILLAEAKQLSQIGKLDKKITEAKIYRNPLWRLTIPIAFLLSFLFTVIERAHDSEQENLPAIHEIEIGLEEFRENFDVIPAIES